MRKLVYLTEIYYVSYCKHQKICFQDYSFILTGACLIIPSIGSFFRSFFYLQGNICLRPKLGNTPHAEIQNFTPNQSFPKLKGK